MVIGTTEVLMRIPVSTPRVDRQEISQVFHRLGITFLIVMTTAGALKGQEPGKADSGLFAITLPARSFIPQQGIDTGDFIRLKRAIRTGVFPHALIQLERPLTPGERRALRAVGVEMLSFVGGEAWYATVSDTLALLFQDNRVLARTPILGVVRWIGVAQPADKIHSFLKTRGPGTWATLSDGRIKLSVEFFEDVARPDARKILERFGASIETERSKRVGFFIVVQPQFLDSLAAQDKVQSIEPYPPPAIEFNAESRAWTNTDAVQNSGVTGRGVVLAVWDSGELDAAHNDLGTRVTYGENPRTNVTSEHSTHVACTMAGNGTVTANLRGHAPGVGRILSRDYSGYVPNEMLESLKRDPFAAANNSWGYLVGWYFDPTVATNWSFLNNQSLFGDYLSITSDFDQIVRQDGLVIVFAIGNDRDNPTNAAVVTANQPADWDQGNGNGGYRTVAPPATGKNIITVGAINDATGNMAPFSNWGPTDDGRIKPDLVAPGVNILSCDDDGNNAQPGDINNQYTPKRGTSMAAPAITGITALVIQAYREEYFGDSRSSELPLPSTVKAVLVHSARDMGNPGPDYQFGWGGVDAQAAVEVMRQHLVVEDAITLSESTDLWDAWVAAGEPELRVTLAWDDSSGSTLVNDLDLVLESPDGITHYPWLLDPANPAVAAGAGADRRNNVEQVRVLNPTPGAWIIHVEGLRVRAHPQNYSLISNLQFGRRQRNFEYTGKLVCGAQPQPYPSPTAPGSYWTTISVHNPNAVAVGFFKKLALAYPPGGQIAGDVLPLGFDRLGPDEAAGVDCSYIERRVFPQGPPAYFEGFLVVESPVPVDVTGEYTAVPPGGGPVSIDVEQAHEHRFPAPPPEPIVHASGTAQTNRSINGFFDLDATIPYAATIDWDLTFESQPGVGWLLVPSNGAKLHVVGLTPVGKKGCAAAPLSDQKVNLDNFSIGTYLCVQTNLGRYSEVRRESASFSSQVRISYTTWQAQP